MSLNCETIVKCLMYEYKLNKNETYQNPSCTFFTFLTPSVCFKSKSFYKILIKFYCLKNCVWQVLILFAFKFGLLIK